MVLKFLRCNCEAKFTITRQSVVCDMSTDLEERQRRNAKFLNFLESEDARDVRELLMEERDV